MTFRTDEDSVHDGAPIMLFEFVAPNTTYRYTDHGIDYSFGGDTYTAITIAHSVLKSSTAGNPSSLQIDMEVTAQLVQDFAFSISERSIALTMTSVHLLTATSAVVWIGNGLDFNIKGRTASVRSQSLLEGLLDRDLPGVNYQPQCQHEFGDAAGANRCKIAPAASPGNGFLLATTVASVVSEREITVATIDGNPDDFFTAGKVIRDSDGEQRTIIDQTGTTLLLEWGFPTLVAPNPVTLIAGCDRKVETCRDDFDNVINFGGTPHMPIKNPYANVFGIKGTE